MGGASTDSALQVMKQFEGGRRGLAGGKITKNQCCAWMRPAGGAAALCFGPDREEKNSDGGGKK